MSSGRPLRWREARELAERASKVLAPTVARLKCVGSVRRKRPYVGDIEFLAEPHFEKGLFDHGAPMIEPVKRALLELGRWVKGGDRQMVVTDLFGRAGVRMDLYLVHPPSSWGVQLGIRTGPAALGKYVVTYCRRNGFRVEGGRALRHDRSEVIPTESEEDFFALAGVECLPPPQRDAQAIALWNDVNRYTKAGTT